MRGVMRPFYCGSMAQLTQVPERVETIVIGGGQAGLSAGYHLARRGRPFLILDANARVGDSWRQRWDTLRLFTSARWDGLDGLPFPAPPDSFPTKDAMADYLETYAAHFKLPIRHGERVERLHRHGRHYMVTTGTHIYEAEHVVVAMANYQVPRLPAFSAELNGDIVQIHSLDYRRPSQLRKGNVLIVGAGNSGAEIAMDLAPHHHILMSGRDTGQVPFKVDGLPARLFLLRLLFRLFFHRVFTIRTPLGRRLRRNVMAKGGPLIRTKQKDLAAVGIERVARVTGVRDGSPLLEDGRVLEIANVVWCSGFTPGFSWIHLPVFGSHGEPVHDGGVVASEPGLYFVGLHFLYAFSSSMIHGVGRDADRIADVIATRVSDALAQRLQPVPSEKTGPAERRAEAIR
jgi:putative flavoprotein involved in K+ transport